MIPVNEDPKLDTENNIICDHKCEGCRYWQRFIGTQEVRQGIMRYNCCFYEADGVQV